MKIVRNILFSILPSFLKIWIGRNFLGYKIGGKTKIGFSFFDIDYLELADGASIGHLSVFKGIGNLVLKENSKIGNLNWVSAYPKDKKDFFQLDQDRETNLFLGSESSITNRHIIDCTGGISIGCFTTLAGFRSQILTHSINVYESRQRAAKVVIGDYVFIGTGVTILLGVTIPDKCVVGAGAVVSTSLYPSFSLFGGVPAKFVKELGSEYKYFLRNSGRVY